MVADWKKSCVTVGLLAVCLLLGQARPGFSRPGETEAPLVVAAAPVKHVVKAGDSINSLAQRYGVPAAAILKANPGLNPTRLQLGQEIVVPGAAVAAKPLLPGIETLPSGPPESVELRPEKAPQATPPLKERELAEPAVRSGASKAAPPAAPAPKAAEPAGAPEPAIAPAFQAAPSPQAVSRPTPAPEPAAPAAPVGTDTAPRSGRDAPGLWAALAIALAVGLGVGAMVSGLCANLLAGLALRLAGQPRRGQVVRLDGCLGRIEVLGWRLSLVRTADGDGLLVPNIRLAREAMVVLPPQAQ